ncbi:hypothetical protein KFK09_028866 [Dendrobium nobile]|uniref:Uncharacterized protein n=1 Tax=Dendrobium nobile TaxID=94219 RepID=A0A8T3A2T0_DENNO|nr:hypothetical protein KFK09_028866 [Dendrobium nobile]
MGILTSQPQCRKKTKRTVQKSHHRKATTGSKNKQHTGHTQSVTTQHRKEKGRTKA